MTSTAGAKQVAIVFPSVQESTSTEVPPQASALQEQFALVGLMQQWPPEGFAHESTDVSPVGLMNALWSFVQRHIDPDEVVP